jgi:hypothetical protein
MHKSNSISLRNPQSNKIIKMTIETRIIGNLISKNPIKSTKANNQIALMTNDKHKVYQLFPILVVKNQKGKNTKNGKKDKTIKKKNKLKEKMNNGQTIIIKAGGIIVIKVGEVIMVSKVGETIMVIKVGEAIIVIKDGEAMVVVIKVGETMVVVIKDGEAMEVIRDGE